MVSCTYQPAGRLLVISRLCAAHLLSNRRPLLFIAQAPCYPITPLHCSASLSTLPLKSPSIRSLSVAGVSRRSVSKSAQNCSLISRVHAMMVMKGLLLIGRRNFISLSYTPVGRQGIRFRSLDLMANPPPCILSSCRALPFHRKVYSHYLTLSTVFPQLVEFQ